MSNAVEPEAKRTKVLDGTEQSNRGVDTTNPSATRPDTTNQFTSLHNRRRELRALFEPWRRVIKSPAHRADLIDLAHTRAMTPASTETTNDDWVHETVLEAARLSEAMAALAKALQQPRLTAEQLEQVRACLDKAPKSDDYLALSFRQCLQLWLSHRHAPTALLIIDVQNDFITGSLALSACAAHQDGAAVVPVINQLRARAAFDVVFVSKDWHPADHVSFAGNAAPEQLAEVDRPRHGSLKPFDEVTLADGTKQTLWPAHCVQDTPGADLAKDLHVLPSDEYVCKGTNRLVDSYSAFFDNSKTSDTGLTARLSALGVERIVVVGLAYDVCVAFTAHDGKKAGFDVVVVSDGCRGIDTEGIAKAEAGLQAAGVTITTLEAYVKSDPVASTPEGTAEVTVQDTK
ncbi:uncharacterized protein MONBRDRAFT_33390 [Monosiga brevicollis MX1]|uniref:nicotinamidase n=1 Tax=Monosiga brevicollis TaxID=81824 RepID=A9V551_MONBE|nr:uncharacterized protein MONBRDRAFT_33390 [Monosiga brevicollis MX1]EDQ87213.1 predicted protein [Monosiga brevicollis MX1]|eukprot:XP_001747826.1 hypothetical protein [Monosiga brevicollis MX1]